jgi:hypothetical protein
MPPSLLFTCSPSLSFARAPLFPSLSIAVPRPPHVRRRRPCLILLPRRARAPQVVPRAPLMSLSSRSTPSGWLESIGLDGQVHMADARAGEQMSNGAWVACTSGCCLAVSSRGGQEV